MPPSHNEVRFETDITQVGSTSNVPLDCVERGKTKALPLAGRLILLPSSLLLCLLILIFIQLSSAFPDKAFSFALLLSVSGIGGFLFITKQVNHSLLPLNRLLELLEKKEILEDSLRQSEALLNEKSRELQETEACLQEIQGKTLQLQSKLETLQRRDNSLALLSNRTSPILSVVSHEIRTPLHGIIGYCSLMRDTQLTPEQEELCAIIDDSAHQLMCLFDDILEISRLESGRVVVEQKVFHLKAFLDEITAVFRHQAKMKSIDLQLEISSGIPPHIVSDPAKLRHILFNLIGNAVKFTNRGSVKVEVRPVPNSHCQNGYWLEWSVSDTGIGIRPEDLNRLFQPFNRADHSDSRRHPGLGLGLSIAQRLCHLLGGDIKAESTLGKGTRFTFQLFFEKAL